MSVYIDTPYVTVDEYARRTGLTSDAVQTMCKRGQLPVKERKKGERFFINMNLLNRQAAEQEW